MDANYTNTIKSVLPKHSKESFGRIKRKYKKPLKIIGHWESLARTK